MAQRTILVQSNAYINIRDGLLSISSERGDVTLPLEEIWMVVVESLRTTLTTASLSQLSDAGVGVMFCGRDHMPNGLLLPVCGNSRHAAIVEDQLSMSKPLAKQLWKRIVQAKILNQAAVLDDLGLPGKGLSRYASSVLSGDSDNREGVAAAAYFKSLISDGTRRSSIHSSALDYGYGVLRAGVGRAVVAGGWLVSRGIHHHSTYNAFNLVDDLIEPFRPLVDLIVTSYCISDPLDARDKSLLAKVFEHTMVIDGKRCSCQQCIEMTVSSLRTAVLEKDASRLLLPKISGLETVAIE